MPQRVNDEPPFEGGSQRIQERRPEVPTGGRAVGQTITIGVSILVVAAAALWILVLVAR